MTVSRRSILTIGAGFFLAGAGGAAYGRFIEPGGSLALARHAFTPPRWTPGLKLRIAALSDLHCGGAHMPLSRIQDIVEATLALEPDLILLLGDYVTSERRNVHGVGPGVWSRELGRLKAPLGVHAILGNHEFWDDRQVQRERRGDPYGKLALLDAGVPVLENDAVRLEKDGKGFWLAGLGDQLAFWVGYDRQRGGGIYEGRDDLNGTLARITDSSPAILLAHEPDMFAGLPAAPGADKVAVTLAGHTHGGQINLLGWRPYVPSRFGSRYAHGRIVEDGRSLIVSAGLGTSGVPVRFGVPPEIVLVELG